MEKLVVTRRVTSPFLQAVPKQLVEFDAYIYAVVKRRAGKDCDDEFGQDVRIDPAILKYQQGIITAHISLDINTGITSIDDLHEDWYEAIEAAFLYLINRCI